MQIRAFRRVPIVLTLAIGLVGCQTTSGVVQENELKKPLFTAESGRTVVYMKGKGFTAERYSADVDRCREFAHNAAKNYTPPSNNTHGAGYYPGGGLLGALIGGLAVGITKGIVTAAQRQDYADERFIECMVKDYQQVHLPEVFEREFAAANSDEEKEGPILETVLASEEFEEFRAWQVALEKSDAATFQAHADTYPDSLLGDLPERYVTYQERVSKKLVSIRSNSFLRNAYFFTYGLGPDGWVEKIGDDGTQNTDCLVRKFAVIRVRVRDGWVQGILDIRDVKGETAGTENTSLVGFIKPNGTYQIISDWPEGDPVILSGEFNGDTALDGELVRSQVDKRCEYGFVRLSDQKLTEQEIASWLGEAELPVAEISALYEERKAALAPGLASTE